MSTMIAERKLRSPLKWHGGKSYLARRIVALMPEHAVYVEPFFGGGNVLLNKQPAELEVAGDLNSRLVGLWRAIRVSEALPGMIASTHYCQAVFDDAKKSLHSSDPDVSAWAFLVRNRMSRGGLDKTFAWSDRLRGGRPGDVNAWETIKAELPSIGARMTDVFILCADALELVRRYDSESTLFYLDPPYVHDTRTAKAAYGEFEMSFEAHEELLKRLTRIQGKFLLSGYDSPLYGHYAIHHDWRCVEFEIANNSGQGKTKQRRIECVWANFDLPSSS